MVRLDRIYDETPLLNYEVFLNPVSGEVLKGRIVASDLNYVSEQEQHGNHVEVTSTVWMGIGRRYVESSLLYQAEPIMHLSHIQVYHS